MNTGIVIYSRTGHTLEVAQKLQKSLKAKGKPAKLMQVTVKDPETAVRGKAELRDMPDPGALDFLYVGAPVWRLSLCPVMRGYLQKLPSLAGKKAACFVTMALPFPFLGGTRALARMRRLLGQKGAETLAGVSVGWGKRRREAAVESAVEQLAALAG